MPEATQENSEKREVRKELARTAGEKKPSEKIKAHATDKFWFVTHGLMLIGCAILYYLIGSKFIPLSTRRCGNSEGNIFPAIIRADARSRFPNDKRLDSIVYNYSWPLFPYTSNEIKFQIA